MTGFCGDTMKDVDKVYYMVKNKNEEGMTQDDIAKEMGISRSMVSKIEEAALIKIRRILRRKGIHKEDVL